MRCRVDFKSSAPHIAILNVKNNLMEKENLIEEHKPKSWIQKLKEESWNAELLVTTLSIFAALNLMDLINWLTNTFISLVDPSQYLVAYSIVYFSLLAVSIMVSMFVIHFFLRAYWIGLLGLNSVFPDYSTENSAYSPLYTEKLLAFLPNIKDSIKKVDELCSVIFSAAFTLLLLYAYLGIWASVYLLMFNFLVEYIPATILLIPLYLIGAMMLIQTLMAIIGNKGALRDNDSFQTKAVRLVKLTSLIVYGPFYKSITQVMMLFGSNFKKKKSLVYLVILFIVSGMFLSVVKMLDTNIPYLINENSYFDSSKARAAYYATENQDIDFLLFPEIESDAINAEVLRLFIPVFEHEGKYRETLCGVIDKANYENRAERMEALLSCYKGYHKISIGGQEIDLDFLRYTHPNTGQSGIITYVPLEGLEKGLQRLIVRKELGEEYEREWSIPFYYIR